MSPNPEDSSSGYQSSYDSRNGNDPVDEGQQNQWWRWPLIPIVAPIAATAGYVLIPNLMWFSMKMSGGWTEDGWIHIYMLPTFYSAAFGGIWVFTSGALAPTGKVIAATVMATVLCMVSLFGLVLRFNAPITTHEGVLFSLSTAGTIIGSIFSVVGVREQYENND